MKPCQPFSIRETLLEPGEPGVRLERCFVEARRFIERTATAELLESIFDARENRQAIAAVVAGPIHVGFLFPGGDLSIGQMCEASVRAGLSADYSTVSSTVIARELGMLAGREQVPTLIFTTAANCAGGRKGYVEAFIPDAASGMMQEWIEQEIGSHVGLTLADHAIAHIAHEAFLAEGFAIAQFMNGEAISNPDAGVSVVYYEKSVAAGTSRIEVLYPMARAP